MMRRRVGMVFGGLAAIACLSGCAGDPLGKPQMSSDLMMGGQYIEPWLGAALKEAETHPLGSAENPVRADRPAGQHAYLARLRCDNDARPTWRRVGNLGPGVFGSIVDKYDVRCAGGNPAQTFIVMDMYFRGYSEVRAVEGFRIEPQ